MKKILVLIAFVFSASITAQDTTPTFEKVGDLVKATYYHDNGEIAQTGYFLNEKLHGQWRMYDEQGRKLATGKYTEGKKSGKWFFWKGKGLSEVDYADSKIVNVVNWSNAESVALNK